MISIVIPNYNTWELVKRNVEASFKYDRSFINEIIVIDDCSPIENYIVFDNKVKIIRNSNNFRYTKSVNIGLKSATNEIIVLLDSDAYPTAPYLEKLINSYSKNPSLGCIGFKTIDENGMDTGNILPEPSVLSLISGQQLHAFLRKFNFFESKNLLPFSCAVSFRKSMLEDIGYFDDRFPVLEADHDLSMRIYRAANWKLIYDQSIQIFHKGGSSIPLNSDRVLLFYKYRWLLLKKYNKLLFPFFVRIFIILRLLIEFMIHFTSWIFSAFGNSIKFTKMKARLTLVKMMFKPIRF